MTYEKHFHCGCVSKYRQSSHTETPAYLPRSLLKLRGDVVCQALRSTIPSAPAVLGTPDFWVWDGSDFFFLRVHPRIIRGLERKKRKEKQNPQQESVEGGGRCYVGAKQGLQGWASWTWIIPGNQPTGTWTGDNCHVSTDGASVPVSSWVWRLVLTRVQTSTALGSVVV